MNSHCFKTVFSKRQGALVAVGEHASNQGKATGAGVAGSFGGLSSFVGALTVGFALVGLAWAGPVATALPTGGQVAQGTASISQSGSVMNINQSTAKAVVNWSSFDIGSGAKVNIVQPGADAVMLNRVTGANPSQIFGQLNANGQVVLVNPNGVLFGKDGSVNASSFTASTLGISDVNFMAGNMQYERNGSTAAIVNQGSIKTTGGYVALLGASVSNEGKIETQGGTAYLAAAETVKIPVTGSGRIKLELSPSSINAAVANAKGGTIVTEGGQVYMQAAALNNAVASIIQSGSIDTTGAQGGAVHLLADGGQIKVDGSIAANSTGQDEQSLLRKGGDIVIGRDEETGVLAKATDVSGAVLESTGGLVETSGDYLATDGVAIKAAQWLLDPSDVTISSGTDAGYTNMSGTYTPNASAGTSVVKVDTIQTAINAGTSVTITTTNTGASGSGAGNITIANPLAFANNSDTNATLSLIADNGITQNAGATITTTAVTGKTGLVNVSMEAKGVYQGTSTGPNANSKGITLNSNITTNGTITLKGTSNAPSGAAGVGVNSLGTLSAGGDVLVTGTANGASTGANTGAITSTGGSVTVIGTSVDGAGATTGVINAKTNVLVKGTSTSGAGVGSIGAIGTTSTPVGGTVNVEGYSSSGSTASTNINSAITATGNVVIKGVGAAKHGVFLNGNVESKAGSISVTGDTLTVGYTPVSGGTTGVGVAGSGTLTAEGNITVIGKTNGDNSIKAFGDITSNNGDVLVNGYSKDSIGVNLTKMITVKNGKVDLIGTSGGSGTHGININANGAGIEAQSYNVLGTSASGIGVNINGTWTNTVKFISTSTTVDSYIEGKTTSGSAGVIAADGILQIDSAATAVSTGGKVFVRNTSDSKAGVNLSTRAIIKTTGDVTFGRNDTDYSRLYLQGVTATADGGKLTFLGKSSSTYGIGFQDLNGVVSISGTKGAAIVLDGTSTAIDGSHGINTRVGSLTAHSVTSSGGSVTIKGTSATGTGVVLDLTSVTSNNGNSIDITGTGGGTGKGVSIISNITADGGGNINITGTANGSGTAVDLTTASGYTPVITASTGKVTIIGNAPGTLGTGVGINSNGNISGGTVEMAGYTAGTGAGISTSGLIKATSLTPGAGSGAVKAGDVKLEGTSAGGSGVVMNSNSATAISASNDVNITGKSTASANATNKNGVTLVGTTTVEGKNVTVTGESVNGNGVITYVAINATSGDAKITGTSTGAPNTASALSLQGTVTASQNVEIKGSNTDTTNGAAAVYVNKAVTATNRKIDITASTAGTSIQAMQLASGAKLTGNTEVNIKADTLSVDTSVNTAVNASTVTIKTDSEGAQINIGASDAGSATTGSRILGLTNAELNQINAVNTVIGDASNTGGITVSQVTTTNASMGNVTLQTGGDIAVNAALTIASGKALTLNGAGASSTISQANTNAGITADKVEFLGDNATVSLQPGSSVNKIGKLAGEVKSFALYNQRDLMVDVINGTTGLKTAGDVFLSTKTATGTALSIAKNIESTAGNVSLNAVTSDTASTANAAVMSWAMVKGKDVTMNAVAQGATGKTLGYRGAGDGGQFIATNNLNLSGSSANDGNGFYMWGGALSARGVLAITGVSTQGQGIGFEKAGANAANVSITSGNGVTMTGTASTGQEAIGLRDVTLSNAAGAVTLRAAALGGGARRATLLPAPPTP